MSRRSIFLIAVTVVVVYFSLILFMLTPLHGARSVYYRNNNFNQLSLRQIPTVHWCRGLRWRSPVASDVVALVSFPGSGNTWLRYLLQQVTGIVTGSIYTDYGLRNHGFPAENVTDGSVLVVKTHEAPPIERDKFKAAILLIRNPRDAILADFNRLHNGHIGTAPKIAFKSKARGVHRTEWTGFVWSQLRAWESLHRMWLSQFPGLVHIVFYEVLVQNPKDTLYSVLAFLNHTVTEEEMECALIYREGIYRRKKKLQDFDPFTADMYQKLNTAKNSILTLVTEYRSRNLTR